MTQVLAESSVSPSLTRTAEGAGPAFELKFLLDEATAHRVESWAWDRLAPDPHGDPGLGGAYRTLSLYCDTPDLAVYNRAPSYRRRKYRVRRYGDSPGIFLERKTKSGDRVAKRRAPLEESQLVMLAESSSPETWEGHWFHRPVLAGRLGPACLIRYDRNAYFGACAEGPLRLTLDRRVSGTLTGEWDLAPSGTFLPLLTGQVILEFKFRNALPTPFKEVVRDLCLTPGVVSKYRLCRAAWGAAPRVGAENA